MARRAERNHIHGRYFAAVYLRDIAQMQHIREMPPGDRYRRSGDLTGPRGDNPAAGRGEGEHADTVKQAAEFKCGHGQTSCDYAPARRDALMAALDRELADLPHEVSRSEAGLHLLLHMRNGMLEHELIERAKTVGVRVYPLSAYYTPPVKPPRATLVLGYAGLTEQQIDEAAKLLKQAWTK